MINIMDAQIEMNQAAQAPFLTKKRQKIIKNKRKGKNKKETAERLGHETYKPKAM